MVALGAFANLSPIFPKLAGDDTARRDADPALRPVRREAGRTAGRGRVGRGQGPAALRLPRAQPAPPDRPRRAADRRLRRGRDGRPPASAQRAALEAAPCHRARAPSRTSTARARAAGRRIRRCRGCARGAAPGRVACRCRRMGGSVGPRRDRLPRRQQASAPGPRPALVGRMAATPRRRSVARARVPRRGKARTRRTDSAAGRGLCTSADRVGPVPRDRLPDPDEGPRGGWERRRGAARLRPPAPPAPRRARDRAQPSRTERLPTPARQTTTTTV